MARTKQTARKSTGGKAPRKSVAAKKYSGYSDPLGVATGSPIKGDSLSDSNKKAKITAFTCLLESTYRSLVLTYDFHFANSVACFVEALNSLSTKLVVKDISLYNPKLGARNLKTLLKALFKATGPTARKLSIYENRISDSSVLVSLLNQWHLNSLALDHCQIGDDQISTFFSHLTKNSHLRELSLENVGMKDGSSIGAALAENTTLEVLNLSGNEFGDATAKEIFEGLKKNKTLRELRMGFTGLSDKIMPSLLDCLKVNKTLKILDISGNELKESEKLVAACSDVSSLVARLNDWKELDAFKKLKLSAMKCCDVRGNLKLDDRVASEILGMTG